MSVPLPRTKPGNTLERNVCTPTLTVYAERGAIHSVRRQRISRGVPEHQLSGGTPFCALHTLW